MSTDLTSTGSTDLAIRDDQGAFSPAQRAALQHLGVEGASDGDLAVFFHVVKRTGLDPFARQVYMISRPKRENVDGRWQTTGNTQTIQTGIDGYRLIGRRAADRAGITIDVDAPEWAHEDGSWRPVWRKAWGNPVAARVTVRRDDRPFTAVAMFDEYAQTKHGGDLNSMWAQRPAGQIAKCAEALAWRLAFPQDLSGLYVEDELQHLEAEPAPAPAQRPAPTGGLRGRARQHVQGEVVEQSQAEPEAQAAQADEQPVDGEVVDERTPAVDTGEQASGKQQTQVSVLLKSAGHRTKAAGMAALSKIIGRDISEPGDLTTSEADAVIDDLQRELGLAADEAGS